MKRMLLSVLFLTGFLLVSENLTAQIKIDGTFFDWKPSYQLDIAPQKVETTFDKGDADCPNPLKPTYFADLDIQDVHATDDADFVYIRIKMNNIANVLNIPNDTSYHGGAAIAAYISVDPGAGDTTGLTWGWWGSGYDFQIPVFPADSITQARSYFQQPVWEHKQTGNGYDFDYADTLIGAQVSWNASNNEVEMAIPKLLLFNPHFINNFKAPDSIAIMIYAGENSSPWRADYACNDGVKGYMMPVKKPGKIAIDGTLADWTNAMQVDVAPQQIENTFADGDPDCPNPAKPAYFADLDVKDVYVSDDADFVYCRIKMNAIANILNIPNDTSYHGGAAIAAYVSVDPGAADTTGLTWGWWGSGYDFFIQAFPADTVASLYTGYQQYLWEHKQTGNGYDFERSDTLRGAWVQWNASNNDCEIAIPKALLFSPKYIQNFKSPDSIAVMIYAGENNSPWRADYASNAGVKGFMYKITGVTSVAQRKLNSTTPSEFEVKQNYPNPFNPATNIEFSIPKESRVKIKIYDVLGRQVATLLDEIKTAGSYKINFNAKNFASGVYFYNVEAGSFSQVRKMILSK